MECGASWSEQGQGLISRRPSWLAAPDRELGKGQPPRGRGWPVHAEWDPPGSPSQINEGSRVDESSAGPGGETLTPADRTQQPRSRSVRLHAEHSPAAGAY